MYNDIIGKKIFGVTRVDGHNDYDIYYPLGLFIDLGEERGLYFGISRDKSINIDLLNKEELNETSGAEYFESDLNELRPNDELKQLVGQTILELRIADFNSRTIKGETFELLLGRIAGIKLKTDEHELVFYNENGGHLLINDGDELPHKERWTWK
jgi:hypothetical protein